MGTNIFFSDLTMLALSPSYSVVDVEYETEVLLDVKEPMMYAVILHNDNYTTMEFVVEMLRRYFNKTGVEAEAVMLQVHTKGRGLAGIYSQEIAETKVDQVTSIAREKGFPLRLTMEPQGSHKES